MVLTNMLKNKKFLIFIVFVILMVIFLTVNRNKLLKIVYPKEYSHIVNEYRDKYNVDEELIYAVIKAESNFKIGAVSNKGAIGLMQLMEETAVDVARKSSIEMDFSNIREELLKPENNINIGTKYLSDLLNRYNNKEIALAAYNAGIGTVDTWIEKGIIKSDGSNIENIPYKETNNYVRKILRDYDIYEDLYKN